MKKTHMRWFSTSLWKKHIWTQVEHLQSSVLNAAQITHQSEFRQNLTENLKSAHEIVHKYEPTNELILPSHAFYEIILGLKQDSLKEAVDVDIVGLDEGEKKKNVASTQWMVLQETQFNVFFYGVNTTDL